MGLDYNFYFQLQEHDRWIVPEGFTNRFGGFCEKIGYFVWFNRVSLFFGESAVIPFATSMPSEIECTALYKQLQYGFNEWYRGWISFEDLYLDEWSTSFLYITTHVPPHLASEFTDGAEPFPEQQLLNRGCSPDEIATYCNDNSDIWVTQPIVPGFRANDFRGWVKVSWKKSIAEVVGDWRVSEFQKLRQFGRDSDLRIDCLYS